MLIASLQTKSNFLRVCISTQGVVCFLIHSFAPHMYFCGCVKYYARYWGFHTNW